MRLRVFLVMLLALPIFLTLSPAPAHAQVAICSAPREVVLTLDLSGSVVANLDKIKEFAQQLAARLDIAPNQLRSGVIGFAQNTTIATGLSDDPVVVDAAISGLGLQGGTTDIANALNAAHGLLTPGRDTVPRVLVILTDGMSTAPGAPDPATLQPVLNAEGSYIIGVAYDGTSAIVDDFANAVVPASFGTDPAINELLNSLAPVTDAICNAPQLLVPVAEGAPCPDVPVPSGSVMGTLVAGTVTYWAPEPGATTSPPVYLEPLQTYWVIGVDATGSYYKLAFGCDYLWVPVEAMAPNPDGIWNSEPLPTRIVQ